MFRLARLLGVSSSLVLLTQTAWAQQQSLKDVYVATSTLQLKPVTYAATSILLEDSVVNGASIQAMAFSPPLLGGTLPERALVTTDGTKLWRFADLNSAPTEIVLPPDLKSLTAVAVSETGSVLVSGYWRPKRVFELWEWNGTDFTRKATGTPQLTDAVYVPKADVMGGWIPNPPAPGYGDNGGVLAAAGRQVLFFPAVTPASPLPPFQVLLDAGSLPVKSNTQLLSVDLVRQSTQLLITTSERTLVLWDLETASLSRSSILDQQSLKPPPKTCQTSKTQRLLVRSADPETAIVSDLCGRVLSYKHANGNLLSSPTTDPLVALAVGEGNEVTCIDTPEIPGPDPCPLSGAVSWTNHTGDDKTLLVLEFNDLCDPRVKTDCDGVVDDDNVLDFLTVLPPSVETALRSRGVSIDLPSYMFSANADGLLGAIVIQTNDAEQAAKAAVKIDLPVGFANLSQPFPIKWSGWPQPPPRPTSTLDLLNQDIAAYAPDVADFRETFVATPITIGYENPMVGTLRGFSILIYGLMYDQNGPTLPRALSGGIVDNPAIPDELELGDGVPPACEFSDFPQYQASTDPRLFFLNLVACLLADEHTLLEEIPDDAFLVAGTKNSLLAQLRLVEDKTIKFISGNGPNTGSEGANAVLTQLGHFDTALAAASFDPNRIVLKNELQVRSAVFRFNLSWNTLTSMPLNGF